jgi:hypothetical protein
LPCGAFACGTNCPTLGLCGAQQRRVVSSSVPNLPSAMERLIRKLAGQTPQSRE